MLRGNDGLVVGSWAAGSSKDVSSLWLREKTLTSAEVAEDSCGEFGEKLKREKILSRSGMDENNRRQSHREGEWGPTVPCKSRFAALRMTKVKELGP